jgi:hypothetical protein
VCNLVATATGQQNLVEEVFGCTGVQAKHIPADVIA